MKNFLPILLTLFSLGAQAAAIVEPFRSVKIVDRRTIEVRGIGGTAYAKIEGSCPLHRTDKILITSPHIMSYSGKIVVNGEKVCNVWKVEKVK